jgi:heme exporter protein CcmD
MNLENFLSMGAYGVYVWSCYGLTLAVLAWSAWSARRRLRSEIGVAKRRSQAQTEVQS